MNNNNFGYMNNPNNPYNLSNQFPQKQQVIKVSGRQGAELYSMGPNSSALLLDESGKLVWLITTDGAGYKSIYPYDINPHIEPPDPHISELENRMAKMEELLNGIATNFAAITRATTGTAVNTSATSVDATVSNDTTKAQFDSQF